MPVPKVKPNAAITNELGSPGEVLPGGYGTDPYETTRELRWPLNLAVYDRMRRTSAQQRVIVANLKGPILGTGVGIPADQDGVREEVRAFVEAELGLAVDGQGKHRARDGGVNFRELLRHALLMFDFGHMFLEQVYAIGEAETPGLIGQVAHLRKLSPRLPRTITRIHVADDGGLLGIRQWVVTNNASREVDIGVERLVAFVHEKEGADWFGQSIFRASYKHWLLADNMMRTAALNHERTGMGLPVVTYPQQGATPSGGATTANKVEALRIARQVRAGEDAGVGLEEGWSIELLGVKGSVMDGLPWVKYHDEAAARATLQMVLNLGHDNGARSLGETFQDIFVNSLTQQVEYVEEVITEHIIRDLVRLNFGDDEPYPRIKFDPLTAETTPTAEALKQLTDAGLIVPDEPLVADVHRRYNLPAPDPKTRFYPVRPALPPTVDPITGLPRAAKGGTAPGVPDSTPDTPVTRPQPVAAAELIARAQQVIDTATALEAAAS